jgi:hypothetical protein
MAPVEAFHPVERVAVARGTPAGRNARAVSVSVLAARVVALLDAGAPGGGSVCAGLWSRSAPSAYGNGRVVGTVELARPRRDARGILAAGAARAWALELLRGVAAEERARAEPAGEDWPGIAEAASLLDDGHALEELRREAEALLGRQAPALDVVRYTLLARGCWFDHTDRARDLAERRRDLGRVVLPFRVRAA